MPLLSGFFTTILRVNRRRLATKAQPKCGLAFQERVTDALFPHAITIRDGQRQLELEATLAACSKPDQAVAEGIFSMQIGAEVCIKNPDIVYVEARKAAIIIEVKSKPPCAQSVADLAGTGFVVRHRLNAVFSSITQFHYLLAFPWHDSFRLVPLTDDVTHRIGYLGERVRPSNLVKAIRKPRSNLEFFQLYRSLREPVVNRNLIHYFLSEIERPLAFLYVHTTGRDEVGIQELIGVTITDGKNCLQMSRSTCDVSNFAAKVLENLSPYSSVVTYSPDEISVLERAATQRRIDERLHEKSPHMKALFPILNQVMKLESAEQEAVMVALAPELTRTAELLRENNISKGNPLDPKTLEHYGRMKVIGLARLFEATERMAMPAGMPLAIARRLGNR